MIHFGKNKTHGTLLESERRMSELSDPDKNFFCKELEDIARVSIEDEFRKINLLWVNVIRNKRDVVQICFLPDKSSFNIIYSLVIGEEWFRVIPETVSRICSKFRAVLFAQRLKGDF